MPATILRQIDCGEEEEQAPPPVQSRDDDESNDDFTQESSDSHSRYVNESSKKEEVGVILFAVIRIKVGLIKRNQFGKSKVCVALYAFESISESTLTISEGDRFRVLQKHDDNMNSDWWLLEKLQPASTTNVLAASNLLVGYVPANYVSLQAST